MLNALLPHSTCSTIHSSILGKYLKNFIWHDLYVRGTWLLTKLPRCRGRTTWCINGIKEPLGKNCTWWKKKRLSSKEEGMVRGRIEVKRMTVMEHDQGKVQLPLDPPVTVLKSWNAAHWSHIRGTKGPSCKELPIQIVSWQYKEIDAFIDSPFSASFLIICSSGTAFGPIPLIAFSLLLVSIGYSLLQFIWEGMRAQVSSENHFEAEEDILGREEICGLSHALSKRRLRGRERRSEIPLGVDFFINRLLHHVPSLYRYFLLTLPLFILPPLSCHQLQKLPSSFLMAFRHQVIPPLHRGSLFN